MTNYTSTGVEQENSNQCNVNHATNTEEFQTIDMSELYFSFQDPETVMHNISANLRKKGVERDVMLNVFDNLKQFGNSDDANLLDVVNRSHQQATSPVSYQIVGDNVDLEVKVRHMTKDNKNKSFHWFNLVAFEDQVSGSKLPNKYEVKLADVPISAFIPSNSDIIKLKQDYIVLWSRVIVKYLKQFSFLRSATIKHIPHDYSETMAKPVAEVYCDMTH